MKVFISMGMRDKTIEEILESREEISNTLIKVLNTEIEVIDSIIEDFDDMDIKDRSLYCLGKSIELLSTADLVVFEEDWDSYRGCKIEHRCAEEYGLKIMYMSGENVYR